MKSLLRKRPARSALIWVTADVAGRPISAIGRSWSGWPIAASQGSRHRHPSWHVSAAFSETNLMRWQIWPALVLLLRAPAGPVSAPSGPLVVILPQPVGQAMNSVFTRFKQHWDELSDLNTMERMLGTIRPTQREYLGCLQGSIIGDTVWIEAALPARDMKQLQLAVTGTCDSIPRLLGSWHTHPYHADPLNLPVKERWLSPQDLRTFAASADRLALVMWEVDSLDAAVKFGAVVTHPALLLLR